MTSGVDQWKMAPFGFNYCCVLLFSLSLLLHFDSDMKHFKVCSLFDSISPKSIFLPYQFSVIILPWIAMACINLFSELMNSGFGSLATSSDPCKWKRGEKNWKADMQALNPQRTSGFSGCNQLVFCVIAFDVCVSVCVLLPDIDGSRNMRKFYFSKSGLTWWEHVFCYHQESRFIFTIFNYFYVIL